MNSALQASPDTLRRNNVTLRTLLVCGALASLFAGCSGGASVPSSGSLATESKATMNLQIDATQLQSLGRKAKFIGASVDTIAWSFAPGPVTGSFNISNCGNGGNNGSGSTYTCPIPVTPGAYTGFTITLQQGATPVGSGVGGAITITGGAVTNAAVQISPINQAPGLTLGPGQPTTFFMDGHAQSIAFSANELDPVGNIITTYYGPITNWVNLSFGDSGGTAGATLPTTIQAPPSLQAGNTVLIQYDGVSANGSNLIVTLSDGAHNTNVSIPYVSMSPSPGALNLPGSASTTMNETITAGTVPDTTFTSSWNCPSNAVGITAPVSGLGSNNVNRVGSNGTVLYTFTALHNGTPGACTLTVSSGLDGNLTKTVTINYPA